MDYHKLGSALEERKRENKREESCNMEDDDAVARLEAQPCGSMSQPGIATEHRSNRFQGKQSSGTSSLYSTPPSKFV